MAIITKSIGTTARDYSTIQAWEDALPVNLVTDGNSQVGECHNDTEFAVAGVIVTFGGETTDATHTITLKCAAGKSFRDNASVQTNALRYNASNGVGLRNTQNYASSIVNTGTIDFVFIDGLQINNSGNSAGGPNIASTISSGSTTNGPQVSNCLLQNDGSNTIPVVRFAFGGKLINSVVIQKYSNASAGGVFHPKDSSAFRMANCTIVCPSDITAAASAIGGLSVYSGTAPVITNCAIFGWTSVLNGAVGSITGSNNATDLSSVGFGSSNQVSKTFTSQFQGTLTASLDLRAKSGADLLNTGATDTTDIPSATDIAGTSRPQGAAWDIGAWELVVAAGFIAAWARNSNLPVIGTGTY